MVTTRNAGWLVTVFAGLVVAGGAPVGRPRSPAADTGDPVAGAKVKVLVQGLPGKAPVAEAASGTDGRYSLELPLGHCHLWGVSTPPGYYTQDANTFGAILTT